MIATSMPAKKRHLRMARRAVGVFFFLNGVMTAALSTRLPVLQTKLALAPDQLGLALLGCTIGGLVATNIAVYLARSFGSKMITTIAAVCMGLALFLIALAPTFPSLILALVFFGVGSGALDITMNIQGTEVEQEYGRPILNAFHACFSIGSLVSALLGSALAACDVSPVFHFLAIVLGVCVGIAWSSRFLLSSEAAAVVSREHARQKRVRPFSQPLILLGVIAFCALLSVGAMFDWSAVYLSDTLHTGTGLAAAGFATFLVCMTLGRSVGDKAAMRFGKARLMRGACLLAALGLALALLFPWVPVVLLGLGLVGIGLAVPFPLVVSAAGYLSRQERNSALATVTTWGYAGLLAGPPVIGFLASREGLRLALVLVVLLCMLATLCASAVDMSGQKDDKETRGKRAPR
ncbi:MAG TPA: MFS transporter [Ktedonobacteraceae bacterium]|nr:MFS transporter [Ktedonobacteraceae bacterium]